MADGMETNGNQRLRDAAREYAEAWGDYKNEKRKAAAVRELEEAARSFVDPQRKWRHPDDGMPFGFNPTTDYEGEDTKALDGAGHVAEAAGITMNGTPVFVYTDEYDDKLTVQRFPECWSFFVDPGDVSVKVPNAEMARLARVIAATHPLEPSKP